MEMRHYLYAGVAVVVVALIVAFALSRSEPASNVMQAEPDHPVVAQPQPKPKNYR